MAKVIVVNPFSSVRELAQTFRVVLPRPHEWRLMANGVVGEVNGVHTMRGVAMATNGVHVAIVRDDKVVVGHVDWFMADKEKNAAPQRNGTKSSIPKENLFKDFQL